MKGGALIYYYCYSFLSSRETRANDSFSMEMIRHGKKIRRIPPDLCTVPLFCKRLSLQTGQTVPVLCLGSVHICLSEALGKVQYIVCKFTLTNFQTFQFLVKI